MRYRRRRYYGRGRRRRVGRRKGYYRVRVGRRM